MAQITFTGRPTNEYMLCTTDSSTGPYLKHRATSMNESARINPNWVLLDSQSTIHLFSNRALIQDIMPSEDPIKVNSTAGQTIVTHQGRALGVGDVWYAPTGIANILSMSKLIAANYKIHFHQAEGKAKFTVINPTNNNSTEFRMSTNGLFFFDTSHPRRHTILANTVAENEAEYTNKQVKDARGMVTIQNITGASDDHLNQAININAIPNLPYNSTDLKNKTLIYEPNLSHLKGKTVRMQPPGVPTQIIPLSPDYLLRHPIINISADTLDVNGIIFLTTIGHELPFVTGQAITYEIRDKAKTLLSVLAIYRRRGFKIGTIHADNGFSHLENDPRFEGVQFNICSANEHVARIERSHRHIQEHARDIYNILPFKTLLNLMIIRLIYTVIF